MNEINTENPTSSILHPVAYLKEENDLIVEMMKEMPYSTAGRNQTFLSFSLYFAMLSNPAEHSIASTARNAGAASRLIKKLAVPK